MVVQLNNIKLDEPNQLKEQRMKNKIMIKNVKKNLERDINYYMDQYEFSREEALRLVLEQTELRIFMLKEEVKKIEKDNTLSDENPFA